MALGDSYATLAELRSRVKITDATYTAEDTRLTAALAAASRGIEKVTGRQFNLAASATARVYYPQDMNWALVDDISSTTGLIVKTDSTGGATYATTWTSSDYQLEPLNGVVDGESGWPYWQLRAVGNFRFPCVWSVNTIAPLQVTATWGWAAVPAPVKEGCLILAEDIYKLADSPFGTGGYGQFGIIRARENPMVWQRVGPYARSPVLVA